MKEIFWHRTHRNSPNEVKETGKELRMDIEFILLNIALLEGLIPPTRYAQRMDKLTKRLK